MTDLICSYYTLAGISPAEGGHSPRDFADRVEAAARAGYKGIGIHIRDYRVLRAAGCSDRTLQAVVRDHGIKHVELEFLLNWFDDGLAGATSRVEEGIFYHMQEVFDARIMFLGGDMQAGNRIPFSQLIDRFAELCGRAAEHGVTIGIEPCAWSNIGTLDEALALLDGAGAANAGLYLDLWHLYRRDLPFDRLRSLRPAQVVGVQLDDASASLSGPIIADCLDFRRLPGEGDADARSFVETLNAVGVSCPISVEIISDAQRTLPLADAAAVSYAAARNILNAGRATAPVR